MGGGDQFDLIQQILKQVEDERQVMKGHAAYADSEGRVGFLPWQHATMQGQSVGGKIRHRKYEVELPSVPEIGKRSLAQRVESLTQRLVDEYRRHPGVLDDSLIRDIAGETWKDGVPLSVERIRHIAATFLQRASQGAQTARPHETIVVHGMNRAQRRALGKKVKAKVVRGDQ